MRSPKSTTNDLTTSDRSRIYGVPLLPLHIIIAHISYRSELVEKPAFSDAPPLHDAAPSREADAFHGRRIAEP